MASVVMVTQSGETPTTVLGDETQAFLAFDTVIEDVDGYFNAMSDPTILAVPSGKAGIFQVSYMIEWPGLAAPGYVFARAGGSYQGLTGEEWQWLLAGQSTSLCGSFIGRFADGDTVRLGLYQNSGMSLDITYAEFGMVRIGS